MQRRFAIAAELWDELAGFDIRDAEGSRSHLMLRLCGLVAACNAVWVAAVRTAIDPDDPLLGWRIASLSYLHQERVNGDAVREMKLRWERGEQDPLDLLMVAGAGTFRAFSLRSALPASWFRGGDHRLFRAGHDIHDALCVATPVTEDAESVFVFHRPESAGAFAEREIELAAHTLRGLGWRHRSWMLERGLLVASKPLTPTERRVLGHLLTAAQEKHIAVRLGLARSTVHDYVKSIYAKFAVGNRAGLMSLWFRPAAPAVPPRPGDTPP